jgi:DNA-binding CsgD family transcriptional regulator
MADQPFLSNLQLIVKGELTQAKQDILDCLKMFWKPVEIDIHEIGQEKKLSIQLSFMSRQWGDFGSIELSPVDPTQTLVRFIIPPYPDFGETERFETTIRESIGPSAVGLRMIDMGPYEGLIAYLGKQLQDRRLKLFNMLYIRLVYSLKMSPFLIEPLEVLPNSAPEGTNHSEISPTQPKENRDIPITPETSEQYIALVSKKNDQILDLWRTGLTAKEIAARLGRTEKTVLNSLTLLRRSFGDQLVPRRK